MKQLISRLLFVGSLLGVISAPAMSPVDYHAELRALKTTYETAINSGDLAPLAPLFDADSSGVTVDNQSFRTFDELKAIYDRFHAAFPGVVYRVKLDAVPSLISGDLAVARGTAEEVVKTSDAEFTYASTWTVILRRTDSGWKLVRSQVTMDPFRNSVVTHLRKKTSRLFGLAGLGAGLALGLLAGLAIRRQRAPA